MTSLRTVNLSHANTIDTDIPLIVNIYLGHLVCKDKSGAGLAQIIIDLLKDHKINHRHTCTSKRCVGFSIDGEYVIL